MESEWQNRATPRPSTATGGARAERLYLFLNFSMWTDEAQPYKSSQRLVKFQSGTNIKCPTVTHRKVLLIY
jgi:hypothetical protein